jgi:hypothetical protein
MLVELWKATRRILIYSLFCAVYMHLAADFALTDKPWKPNYREKPLDMAHHYSSEASGFRVAMYPSNPNMAGGGAVVRASPGG